MIEGYKIGVSSRGTGTVRDIVENFSLTTYDAVSAPSDYNANLQGLCESLESSVILDSKVQTQDEKQDNLDEAINSKNWSNLKELLMKNGTGFSAWEFEGDYETLIIIPKLNQVSLFLINSNKSANELMSYGDD